MSKYSYKISTALSVILLCGSFAAHSKEYDITIDDMQLDKLENNSRAELSPNAEIRISKMEEEMRNLNGKIELLEHRLAQLQATLENNAKNLVQDNKSVPNNNPIVESEVNKPELAAKKAEEKNLSPEDKDKVIKNLYNEALADLKKGDLSHAEAKFGSFLEKYPAHQLASNSYFWYAETFYRKGNHEKAALHYLKGYKAFPKGAKASDSLLKLALSLGEINKKGEACKALTKLEKEFPNRPSNAIKRAKDAAVKFGCK